MFSRLQLQRFSTVAALEVVPPAAAVAVAVVAAAAAAAPAAAAPVAAAAAAAAAAADRYTHCRKSPWAAAGSGSAEGCGGRSRR